MIEARQCVYGSRIEYESLDGAVVEWDFEAADADAGSVEKLVTEMAVEAGIARSAITFRNDVDGAQTYTVAVLQLSAAEFQLVLQTAADLHWIRNNVFKRGLHLVGQRVARHTLNAFAVRGHAIRTVEAWQPDPHHAQPRDRPITRPGTGFNKDGRRYEMSEDGGSWVDTGPSTCC